VRESQKTPPGPRLMVSIKAVPRSTCDTRINPRRGGPTKKAKKHSGAKKKYRTSNETIQPAFLNKMKKYRPKVLHPGRAMTRDKKTRGRLEKKKKDSYKGSERERSKWDIDESSVSSQLGSKNHQQQPKGGGGGGMKKKKS